MNLKKKFFFISKKRFFDKNIISASRKSGINFSGKKTVRGRGFINKKKKRMLDNFRAFWHIRAVVLNFEYDPNRKNLISLIAYINGIFSYSLALEYFFVGFQFYNGNKIPLSYGSSDLLLRIPQKVKICCLEVKIFEGFKFLKSCGAFGKKLKKSQDSFFVKLRSKRNKKIFSYCTAIVGSILIFNFNEYGYKKASFSRFKGFRSKVRGVAMNPVDHPHGGGEGKKSKKADPMSVWGKKLKFKKNEKKR